MRRLISHRSRCGLRTKCIAGRIEAGLELELMSTLDGRFLDGPGRNMALGRSLGRCSYLMMKAVVPAAHNVPQYAARFSRWLAELLWSLTKIK